MRKKDYELIADSLWRSKHLAELDKNRVRRYAAEAMRRLVAIDLASTLGHDNPKFDRNKFLTACGIQD